MVFFLLFVLFAYVIAVVWPQRQRVRAQQTLLAALEVGDEVMTTSGLIGRVVVLGDQEVALEVAPATIVRFARFAIARKMPAVEVDPQPTEHAAESVEAAGSSGAAVDVMRESEGG